MRTQAQKKKKSKKAGFPSQETSGRGIAMIQGMEGTARAVLVGETETNGPYLSVLLHAAVE